MKWLKAYFNFSKGETIGFTVLAILLIALLVLPVFIDHFSNPIVKKKEDAFNEEVRQFLEKQKTKEQGDTAGFETSGKSVEKYDEPVYFEFNPNDIGYEEWRKLGLSAKLAHTIENYKKAGGKFYEKSDLKAVYGLNDSIYKRIAPYMKLPGQNKQAKARKDTTNTTTDTNQLNEKEEKKQSKITVALNTADTAELKEVNGIGDFFAREIVEKRQSLGGFHNKSQLLMVYRLDTGNLDKIKPQLTLKPGRIDPLSLNDSSFKAFLKHPYLDYADVKAIFDYKEKQEKVDNIKKLKDDQIIGERLYHKIEPYLVP